MIISAKIEFSPPPCNKDGDIVFHGAFREYYALSVNGVACTLGDKTAAAYVSRDNGETASIWGTSVHWNPSVAGYSLETTDVVTIEGKGMGKLTFMELKKCGSFLYDFLNIYVFGNRYYAPMAGDQRDPSFKPDALLIDGCLVDLRTHKIFNMSSMPPIASTAEGLVIRKERIKDKQKIEEIQQILGAML